MSKIIEQIESGLDNNVFTAATIHVVHEGEVFLSDAFGVLDPRDPERTTSIESLFDLASLTKVFVATSFMRLAEEGAINIDDKVETIIPEFKGRDKDTITFRHLLSHSSGLPASFNLYEHGEWNQGKDVVLKKLFNTDLVYATGTQVVYSCLGFVILGTAMERITGQGLDAVLNTMLFRPMGWSDILYRPDSNMRNNIAITTFERPNRGVLLPGVVHDGSAIALDGGISGNAGLFGTARTVGEFGQTFLDHSLLSPRTIHLMTSLQAEYEGRRRGLGLQLHSDDRGNSGRAFSPESFGHTGFTGTSLWIDPAENLVVSFLTNSVHFYQLKTDSDKFNTFRYLLYKNILHEINDES